MQLAILYTMHYALYALGKAEKQKAENSIKLSRCKTIRKQDTKTKDKEVCSQ
jgi:hypothetical protein